MIILPFHWVVIMFHMLQGFNLTLTAQVEGLGRRAPDQLKLRLHSHLHDVFGLLCSDPKTTIIILSGSERSVLDEVAELLSHG